MVEQIRNEKLKTTQNKNGSNTNPVVDDLLRVSTRSDLPARTTTARTPGVGAKNHFSCAFVYGPGAGCVMKTDSLTEKRLALVLLARAEVADLENQVLFHWIDKDGTEKKHFFDFRATMMDGSRVAIMVKYHKKLEQEGFRDEIACIASQVTPDFADRVTLVTEKHLDPIELHNATLFNAVRDPDPAADSVMRDAVANLVGAVKISDLIAHTGLGGRGFRAITRLIGNREASLQRAARIDYNSFIIRSAA
jgi:hypothetical protein